MKEAQYKDYVGETREYRKGMLTGFTLIFLCLTLFASLFLTVYVFNRYDDKVDDLVNAQASLGGGTGGTGGGGDTGGGGSGDTGGDGDTGGGGGSGPEPTDVPVVTQAPVTQQPATQQPATQQPSISPSWDPNGAILLSTSRYAISEQNLSVTNEQACTFMVWVRMPNTFSADSFVMAAVDGVGTPGWSFALSNPDTLRFAFYNTSNGVEIIRSNPIPGLSGTGWHLVGFSFEPGNTRFIVDDTIYGAVGFNNRNMRATNAALQLNGFNGHASARQMLDDYSVAQCIVLNRAVEQSDLDAFFSNGRPNMNAGVAGMTHLWNLNDINEGASRPNRANFGPANTLSLPAGFTQVTGP